ncbi:MAG: methyltransferase [Syntrophobacteraceae bacterium]
MSKQISEDILIELDLAQVEGNTVRLVRQLDRKTYLEVNKVLDSLGGQWNRKAKGHVFPEDPKDAIDAAILTGEYTNAKADFGFFETPRDLAKSVIDFADIHTSHSILEPSAGTGALLAPLGEPKDLLDTLDIVCVEIQPPNVKILRTKGYPCGQADFLKCYSNRLFDRVIMNPPFAKQADVDHVMHAYKFLKPGGRLVSIMSAGVNFRDNKKAQAFNDLLADTDGEIHQNPDGSFKASGTMVNTVTVVIDKPEEAA